MFGFQSGATTKCRVRAADESLPCRDQTMSFQLAKDEPLNAGVARVIREQIAGMLQEWEQRQKPAPVIVHHARKSCKMIRGAMRLVRPRFDEYSEENRAIRDAARLLAESRQSTALNQSFDALLEWVKGRGAAVNVDRMKIIGHVLTSYAPGPAVEDVLPAGFAESMRAVRQRSDDWHIRGAGFSAIGSGLKTIYGDGRDALRKAMDDTTVENLHEWRKLQKYHWYHARLLRSIWKPMMKTWADQLKQLSDLLGDDHDLAILRMDLAKRQAAGAGDLSAAIEDLLPMLDARQTNLREEAFALGERIYAEPPGALMKRMRSYWKHWTQD